MKVTKFEHACLMLDNGVSRLLIDPGAFTHLPENLAGISAVVITEEHTDHFNLANIHKVLVQNPEVKIYSTKSVCNQLNNAKITCREVEGEDQVQAGGFTLTFKEGDHAVIYGASPCRVITLRVDEFLYYPSDSFITTGKGVQVLALPTSGPWHKLSEAVEFANKINSKQILVTHNGLYNETGNNVNNNFTSANIADSDREYIFLEVGQTKEL